MPGSLRGLDLRSTVRLKNETSANNKVSYVTISSIFLFSFFRVYRFVFNLLLDEQCEVEDFNRRRIAETNVLPTSKLHRNRHARLACAVAQ